MPTTVRNLTPDEQTELRPILQALHEHVANCAACRDAAAKCETAADFTNNVMCSVGGELYLRWIRWLMNDEHEIRRKAAALYKPPFRYEGGYIWDADGEMLADHRGDQPDAVLRVRGWGRLANVANTSDEAEALQDAYGEVLAEALTLYWNKAARK